MNKAFPEALVTNHESLIAGMKNDEKDRHVAAAAVKAGAQVIVTMNLRAHQQHSVGTQFGSGGVFFAASMSLLRSAFSIDYGRTKKPSDVRTRCSAFGWYESMTPCSTTKAPNTSSRPGTSRVVRRSTNESIPCLSRCACACSSESSGPASATTSFIEVTNTAFVLKFDGISEAPLLATVQECQCEHHDSAQHSRRLTAVGTERSGSAWVNPVLGA
jgi:hypothetical protein